MRAGGLGRAGPHLSGWSAEDANQICRSARSGKNACSAVIVLLWYHMLMCSNALPLRTQSPACTYRPIAPFNSNTGPASTHAAVSEDPICAFYSWQQAGHLVSTYLSVSHFELSELLDNQTSGTTTHCILREIAARVHCTKCLGLMVVVKP